MVLDCPLSATEKSKDLLSKCSLFSWWSTDGFAISSDIMIFSITSHICTSATPEVSQCIYIFKLNMHRQLSFLICWRQTSPRARRITAKCWVPRAYTGITHPPGLPFLMPYNGYRSSPILCQMTNEIYPRRYISRNHILNKVLLIQKLCSRKIEIIPIEYRRLFNTEHGHTYKHTHIIRAYIHTYIHTLKTKKVQIQNGILPHSAQSNSP